MAERFDKAYADLSELRRLMTELIGEAVSGELGRTAPAVDAAFKSEILEQRIRLACRKQALHETVDADSLLNDTPTGRHFWDFDWWLTEATLRSLHAGSDTLAQLLNLVFALGKDSESTRLGQEVLSALHADDRYAPLAAQFEAFRKSEPHKALSAFVNYVKHYGFPRRTMESAVGADGLSRVTTISRFVYRKRAYGAWAPEAVDLLVDDYRREYLKVLDVAVAVRGEG